MNILIGCECSGVIREAFRAKGHNAISCDLKPARDNSPHHIQADLFSLDFNFFQRAIIHPPCTFLTVTANKWLKDQPARKSGALVGKERREAQQKAIDFFIKCWNIPIEEMCLENPVGIMSTVWRKPDQIISPHYFGDKEPKTTCLWLRNLPKLFHAKQDDLFASKTHVEPEYHTTKSGKRMPKWYAYADKTKGQEHRAEIRSNTFPGIANAMADQWL